MTEATAYALRKAIQYDHEFRRGERDEDQRWIEYTGSRGPHGKTINALRRSGLIITRLTAKGREEYRLKSQP